MIYRKQGDIILFLGRFAYRQRMPESPHSSSRTSEFSIKAPIILTKNKRKKHD